MKKLSLELLAKAVTSSRKANKITQAQLAKAAGMNRSILSRLESADYMPSVDQLMALSQILGFDPMELFEDDSLANDAAQLKPCILRKLTAGFAEQNGRDAEPAAA